MRACRQRGGDTRSLTSATFHLSNHLQQSRVEIVASRSTCLTAGSWKRYSGTDECKPVHGARSTLWGWLVCREWYRLPYMCEFLLYQRLDIRQSFVVVICDVLQIVVLALSREGSF